LAPQVKIVTDSTAYLVPKAQAEHDIQVIPIRIAFGTEVFSEGVDITNEEFYRRLAASSRLPTTSQPPVSDFVEVYSRLSALGHPIFSIHLSAKFSGTVNVALAAREQFPQAQIEVVDWLSMGMGLLAVAAARTAETGQSLAQHFRHGGYPQIRLAGRAHRGGQGAVRLNAKHQANRGPGERRGQAPGPGPKPG
jgi:DegV family protein with EDD domain